MQYLDDALRAYSRTDIYPFHMPGHKRRPLDFPNPYEMDITEIDGFDNLHHAKGILKEAQMRAASLYGSDRCFYLVNGSTCGILAAISAAVPKGAKVLVARNSHKAVYHALSLRDLRAEYLYPSFIRTGLQGQITKKQVKDALAGDRDIAAVIITSPTYEGIVSDVEGIASIAHSFGVPLIVDEAHGAHLGFGHGFPKNAIGQGADAVIMSLHKTLPSFTQTALLHLNSGRILSERIACFLDIFETSSPSYLFMAGMDACVRMMTEQKDTLFLNYRKKLDAFYKEMQTLKALHVLQRDDLKKGDAYDWDDSKIVIFTDDAGITGEELSEILLKQWNIQMEMTSGSYVLGMTSLMDEEGGFARLAEALRKIDCHCKEVRWEKEGILESKEDFQEIGYDGKEMHPGESDILDSKDSLCEAGCICQPEEDTEVCTVEMQSGTDSGSMQKAQDEHFISRTYRQMERKMEICQAAELWGKEVPFEEAISQIAANYIYLYPPGIPMIVPGEVIDEQLIENIRECEKKGLRIQGGVNPTSERIKIVYF